MHGRRADDKHPFSFGGPPSVSCSTTGSLSCGDATGIPRASRQLAADLAVTAVNSRGLFRAGGTFSAPGRTARTALQPIMVRFAENAPPPSALATSE